MTRHHTLALLLLTACAPLDLDLDWLDEAGELAAGTDPELADSDGDGLEDGVEVRIYRTDPLNPDTDGDGSEDGWEVSVGLDPLNPRARRYPNDWPHLDAHVKAELERREMPLTAEVGLPFKNVELYTGERQPVELYDFAREGKPVVVVHAGDLHLGDLAAWLKNDSFASDESLIGNPTERTWEALVQQEARVVFLASEVGGENPVAVYPEFLADLQAARDLPTFMPLLGDEGFNAWGFLGRPGEALTSRERFTFATFAILDEDMIVQSIDDWSVLEAMLDE